jgi:hypothetical protein
MPPTLAKTVSPVLLQRYQKFYALLQPVVRLWIDQQARVEARRPTHDMFALRNLIRARFAGSLDSLRWTRGTNGMLASDRVIDAILFLLLMKALDSDNETSDMESMQLQMIMDARSKLLQTASDIEKSMSDTAAAVAQNMKS